MSEFDIKKYLKKLKKTVEEKELESFYIMCDRNDFKPIKGYDTHKEFEKTLKEKKQYYAGKRVADISIYVNLKGLKKNEFVLSVKIVIYKIRDNGKLSQSINDTVGVRINYEPDDLERRNFHLKDVEKFMRLCANDDLYIETLNGQWYKKIVKMLKKKGIDFEDD